MKFTKAPGLALSILFVSLSLVISPVIKAQPASVLKINEATNLIPLQGKAIRIETGTILLIVDDKISGMTLVRLNDKIIGTIAKNPKHTLYSLTDPTPKTTSVYHSSAEAYYPGPLTPFKSGGSPTNMTAPTPKRLWNKYDSIFNRDSEESFPGVLHLFPIKDSLKRVIK